MNKVFVIALLVIFSGCSGEPSQPQVDVDYTIKLIDENIIIEDVERIPYKRTKGSTFGSGTTTYIKYIKNDGSGGSLTTRGTVHIESYVSRENE